MHEELIKTLFEQLLQDQDVKELHFVYDENNESSEITIDTLDGQQLTMMRSNKKE